MIGFKCDTCKGFISAGKIGSPTKMHFKWKDKTRMVKVHVCEKCWSRARSLKVE